MRRGHDTRFLVSEEHRRTVGREDAKEDAGTVGDHCVGMGPLILVPGLLDLDDRRRMNLVDRGEACAGQHCLDRTPPILGDQLWIIAAAVAHVEAPHLALRDAASTAEEAVRQVAKDSRTDDVDGHKLARMMMSSSACSPTMNL